MQLDNLDDLNNKLLKKEFDRTLTTNTKFILQAELRQNYFHAIESFFEIFFALIPDGEKVPDNTNIVQRLVKSNWRKNYNKRNKSQQVTKCIVHSTLRDTTTPYTDRCKQLNPQTTNEKNEIIKRNFNRTYDFIILF